MGLWSKEGFELEISIMIFLKFDDFFRNFGSNSLSRSKLRSARPPAQPDQEGVSKMPKVRKSEQSVLAIFRNPDFFCVNIENSESPDPNPPIRSIMLIPTLIKA
jgi:hypothetical protein